MKYFLAFSLVASCLCLAGVPSASAAAVELYNQDFQSFPALAPGTANPDGWVGVRAFGGPGTPSVEGGANDIALIAQGSDGFIATRDLGVTVSANTTYTLDLDGGLYTPTAGKSSTLRWELGTINGGVFSAFSTFNFTTLTNVVLNQSFFGTGDEVALAQYSFTTGGGVGSDNIAIRIEMIDTNDGFGGFDSIVVTSIPEPGALVLIGFGLAGFASRRWRA